MIQITDKSRCCGCTTCAGVCPKKCITMKPDEEGFLYPVVDPEKCIDCHKCEKVCPMTMRSGINKSESRLLGIQNSDLQERMTSTAGGAFAAIADFLIDNGGVVYAVGYDENVVVCHKKATDKQELQEMKGSKYVQSYLGDTYSSIKADLNKGETVLFVGTPCQVHGLINCVGLHENLYTIDLLCLGVSSPGLFAEYIEYLTSKYNTKVDHVEFRNKYFGYSTPNVRVCFSNGKYIQQKYDSRVHSNLFFKNYYNVRPSCYLCQFREQPRVSDFTIGDFTDIGSFSKEMDDDKGATRMWVHSEKGRALLDKITPANKVITLETGGSNVVGGPKKQINMPARREEFWKDAAALSYAELVNKWEPNRFKGELVSWGRKLLYYLPGHKQIFKIMRNYKRKQYLKNVRLINGDRNEQKD